LFGDQALEFFRHVGDRADFREVVERKRNVVRVFQLFDELHDFDRRQTNVVHEIAIFVDDGAVLGELVDKLLQASGIILAFFHDRDDNLGRILTGGDYTDNGAASDTAPRVWAIASYRAGENSQIFGLANRLGAAVDVKRLHYNRLAGPIGLLRSVSRRGIDETSDPLVPPWPALIVSAGVKNEPVCRWIQAQSGGRTRLVFLGRTWAKRNNFDLVITTPQYRLPHEPNVVHNLMTQHGVVPERLAANHARWEPLFAGLPRPWLGVLIGGDSGPFVLGPRAAARLAAQINKMVEARGGSAVVTTSARTRRVVADVLERELKVPVLLHRYREDDPNNPYLGVLALADALIVTSDSVAMLSEAAATGSPVCIFDLGAGERRDHTVKSVCYRFMMAVLPERLSRDIGLFHAQYIAAGYGSWSFDGHVPQPASASASREIDATVARVRGLVGELA
jgi:mitochondrial fission protein ELM1